MLLSTKLQKNNMKQISCILTILFFTSTNVNGQTIAEILKKYYEASGVENFKEVETIQYTGSMKNHFLKKISDNVPEYLFKPDFKITASRNEGYLFEIFDRKEPTTYGYFKGQYWADQEGYPPEKWEPNNYDRLKIQFFLDFEGFLFDWKKKGMQLEKLKNIQIDNKTYYQIRVTAPEADVLYFYINPKNNLLEKISFFGDLVEDDKYNSVTFSDFKEVEGVQIAFNRMYNTKMIDGSFGKGEVLFKKIEFNVNVDPKIFQFKSRL